MRNFALISFVSLAITTTPLVAQTAPPPPEPADAKPMPPPSPPVDAAPAPPATPDAPPAAVASPAADPAPPPAPPPPPPEANKTYPLCSATVQDNCVNRSETGTPPRHKRKHR